MSTKPGVTNAPSASIVRRPRPPTVADLDDPVAVDRDVAGEARRARCRRRSCRRGSRGRGSWRKRSASVAWGRMETVPESVGRRSAAEAGRARLPRRRGTRDLDLPRAAAAAAAAPRRRGRASARPRSRRCSPQWTGGELVRLQCYEGIDAAPGRLRVGLRAPAAAPARARGERSADRRGRAVLGAVPREAAAAARARARAATTPPVLLIDEVDRADDEFEAFLLELLSDWTISVPELGAVHADVPPIVVLTSNRTRDVHDALEAALPLPLDRASRLRARARDHPPARARGVASRSRATSRPRSRRCATSSSTSRRASPRPSTGRSRSRRSARARLDERSVDATLGTILKYHEDHDRVRAHGLDELRRAPRRLRSDLTWPTTGRGAGADRSRSRSRGCCAARASTCRSARRSTSPRALDCVGLDTAGGVYWAGRATLVRRPDDIAAYDRAFAAFWTGAGPAHIPTTRSIRAAHRRVRRRDADRRRRRRRRRSSVRPSVTVRWSPVETLARPRLRVVHRRASSPRPAG